MRRANPAVTIESQRLARAAGVTCLISRYSRDVILVRFALLGHHDEERLRIRLPLAREQQGAGVCRMRGARAPISPMLAARLKR